MPGLISAGNIENRYVPLADILDRLKGRLGTAEVEKILIEILSKRKREVRPGDLITAELMNQVLTELANLEARVVKLEAGQITVTQPVVISDAVPDPQKVGLILTVTGSNFPKEPEKNANVTLGNVPVVRFQSASDTELVFSVPSVSAPGDFDLTVRNGTASDTMTIHILPRGSNLRGKVIVTSQTPRLAQIRVGNTYKIDFLVDSQTNIDEAYTIVPKYTEIDGTAQESDWLDNTKVTDFDTGRPLEEKVLIEPGTPLAVRLLVKIPSGAKSAKLVLAAMSTTLPRDTGLNQVSNPAMTLKVGDTVATSDPRTTITLRTPAATSNARKATIDGDPGGIELAFGKEAFIGVTATFDLAGTYTFSHSIEPDSTGWTVDTLDPTDTTKLAANGSEDISVKVKSAGRNSEKRTLTIKAVRDKVGTEPKFESWIEIPIRGF